MVDGQPAIEQFAALQDALGPDAAALFAEPLISRGNDKAAATVSWYSDHPGAPVPLAKLDPNTRAAASAALQDQLNAIKDRLEQDPGRAILAAALHLPSAADIMAIDGQPILINWGMVPDPQAMDGPARKAQYDRTLGAYLPLSHVPPLTEAERGQWRAANTGDGSKAALDAGTAAAATAGAAAGASLGGGGRDDGGRDGGSDAIRDTGPAQNAPRPVPFWAWLPLLLLLLLFGGALIWLLLPGNRIFASDMARPAVSDAAALRAAEDTNRGLRARLSELQTTLEGAQCRPDGTLITPEGITIDGLLPPDPRAPKEDPGTPHKAEATPVVPPDPARVVVAPNPGQIGEISDKDALLSIIDARTAMVIAIGDSSSTGTGFFVAPDLMVTNFHVVAKASADKIFVTNKSIGTLKRATIVKMLGPMDTKGADFALLRVADVSQPAFAVRVDDKSLRLQSVIAAGYPGDLLRTDAAFKALQSGDLSAVPDLAVTEGSVVAEQDLSDTTHAVVHSAPISTGNSGGPLIDMCGRVVGVNTFVVKGPMRSLNFALASDDLMAFLGDAPVQPRVVSGACVPLVTRPSVPEADSATEEK